MASFLLSRTAQHYRQRRSVQKVYQNEIRHVCKDNPYTRLIKFPDDLPKIIDSQRTRTSGVWGIKLRTIQKTTSLKNPNHIIVIINSKGRRRTTPINN